MLATLQDQALDSGPHKTAAEAERFCAATGTVRPVEEMIRFVLSPEGSAVPDLKRRLPGRGVWITATRQALRKAIARKAFARSFKRDVEVAKDLVETTERLLERAALEALGIAHKAGRAALGFAKVEAALAHSAVALLHASDAAPDGVRKLGDVMRREGSDRARIAVVRQFTSAQLDLALGRPNVIHAALLSGPESKAFLARAARLERFRAGDQPAGDRTGRKAPGLE
ncbi:MAG: RNA-binding protein [Xanthobacteraceae bacterium]